MSRGGMLADLALSGEHQRVAASIVGRIAPPFIDLTRTQYEYDGNNRLANVVVDLTPDNNQSWDGNRYVTSYTYHGASMLVAAITQTDGSRLDIGYDGHNRVTSMTQTVADGVGRTTTIGYGTGYTNVTDPQGRTTRLDYATDDFAVDVDTWVAAPRWRARRPRSMASRASRFAPHRADRRRVGGHLQRPQRAQGRPVRAGDQPPGGERREHARASARILSGPGTITNIGGGIFRKSGLSNSQPTRVQIIRTYDRDESGGAYFYVDNPHGYRAGVSLIAGAPMLTRLSPRPTATAGQLLLVTLPPAQNGAPQQVVRFAYDAAGNLASTSNAAGTTHLGYDKRGNVVRVEDPNGSVTTRIYEARNLLLAETVIGSDQNGAAAQHTRRFAYDGAARLRYAVDEEGGVANGQLTAGSTLALPAGVIRSTYNAGQLRPYDPADAIGDVSPVSTQPTARAKKNKCGAFGKILLVAAAAAVTVVSSGRPSVPAS